MSCPRTRNRPVSSTHSRTSRGDSAVILKGSAVGSAAGFAGRSAAGFAAGLAGSGAKGLSSSGAAGGADAGFAAGALGAGAGAKGSSSSGAGAAGFAAGGAAGAGGSTATGGLMAAGGDGVGTCGGAGAGGEVSIGSGVGSGVGAGGSDGAGGTAAGAGASLGLGVAGSTSGASHGSQQTISLQTVSQHEKHERRRQAHAESRTTSETAVQIKRTFPNRRAALCMLAISAAMPLCFSLRKVRSHGRPRQLAVLLGSRQSRGQSGCVGCAGGSVNENVAPPPGLLLAQMQPPWASIVERQIARPMPVPSAFVVK